MDIEAVAKDVIQQLRRHTNKERQAFTVNYFPSAMENLGVSVGDLRKVVRGMKKSLRSEAPDEVLSLIHAILKHNTLEGRQTAYEILKDHEPTVQALTLKDYELLGKGMDNWVSVDVFATSLTGQAFREGKISEKAIHRWARSKNPWWRRAAIVSTIPLNMKSRGGTGDSKRTIAVCELVAEDPDDMVGKGLSWALRSLIPISKTAVQEFLKKHDEVLQKRVKREVQNKLKTGLKSGKT